eukprot:1380895-Rhodomonas_salina.3
MRFLVLSLHCTRRAMSGTGLAAAKRLEVSAMRCLELTLVLRHVGYPKSAIPGTGVGGMRRRGICYAMFGTDPRAKTRGVSAMPCTGLA